MRGRASCCSKQWLEQLRWCEIGTELACERRVGMADFLFEIGLEEVPARMIAGAEAELKRRVLAYAGA